MPRGPDHTRILLDDDGEEDGAEPCACTIGEDHDSNGVTGRDFGIYYALSEDDATDIWRSRGEDEDYDFRP